ncbi:sensor histidine kinase [Actinomadura rudentiformis]|uniref:histidine kinase n=1 Tax=Actinomadura rudentiformis TaxID=359158 RepID=A0A6H9Y6A1_9ACTN|nr:histidine kinase [Actinomadura rudentiformis]KAB2337997.1 sensor histidine kinase [Actinomadura rudentiformis]
MMNVGTAGQRLREAARLVTRPSGSPRRPGRLSQVGDAVLALILTAAAVEYAIDKANGRGPDAHGVMAAVPPAGTHSAITLVTVAVVASAALAWRRRFPLAVLWIVMGATAFAPQDLPKLTFYACVIAVYSAAAYSRYRVLTLATLPVAFVLVGTSASAASLTVSNDYVPLLILVPLAMTANGLRTWKLRADEGRARLAALEREQAEALRRAVEHERARIARELHDVVTHNVSVMVIQAGAARKIMATDTGQAGEALLAVESGGRAALTELRHVMGLLTMDADGPGLAPQPGLDHLETLVGRVRDSGLPVELTVIGQARPVPPGVELAAYRVVQEALTNTVKHASGATAEVTVEYAPDHLRVEITDTGGTPGTAAATGNGRGLLGLRERLGVYGGTLHTGRRFGGGYRVRALIPVEAA